MVSIRSIKEGLRQLVLATIGVVAYGATIGVVAQEMAKVPDGAGHHGATLRQVAG
ncbi:hypothetical protein PanWU01x14_141100 [Parasponia andersonii]|uniref:Uncharacterized protein n=1 Tax=Parasponia andersonii TaxID=3476 RepID=A0A2P5CM37_PARAD|nr:hypothetical protein PanWU01x14_141100 [Parasponia andersonii]